MAESMVAYIRQQINREQEAAQQGLYGLAIIANHQAINARMERVSRQLQALYAAGRKQEAEALLMSDELYEHVEDDVV